MTPEELYAANVGIVRWAASRLRSQLPHPKDDDGLTGECFVGLWKAARAYKQGKMPFGTYAMYIILRHGRAFVKLENRRGMTFTGDSPRSGEPAPKITTAPASDLAFYDGVYNKEWTPIDFVPNREPYQPPVEWTRHQWGRVYALLKPRDAKWLGYWLKRGWTARRIAERHGVGTKAVHSALRRATEAVFIAMHDDIHDLVPEHYRGRL